MKALHVKVLNGPACVVAPEPPSGRAPAESQAFWPVYRDYRTDMAKVDGRLVNLPPPGAADDGRRKVVAQRRAESVGFLDGRPPPLPASTRP